MKETELDQAIASSLDSIWLKLRGIERITEKVKKIGAGSKRNDNYLFITSRGSRGGIVIDGCYCSLRPGSVFICSSGQRVEWIDKEPDDGIYVLHFMMGQIREPLKETTTGEASVCQALRIRGEYNIVPAASILDKCQIIEQGWSSGSVPDRLYSDAAFFELLGMTLNSMLQKEVEGLGRARLELETRFTETIPVDQLAELAGMSRYHFMRSFKEKYGKSVVDYATELRMNEAKRLMAEKNKLSLRAIAERAGYNNATYFSRLFKKQVGLAPVVYLRNRAWKVAAYSWANIGQLLPLQIIPHAAPIDQYWNDYYRKKYQADVTVLLSHDYEFNREALRRSPPDCIVALDYNMPAGERKRLEEIAPVLLIPWEGTDWRGHLRVAADFTNKASEAESWLSQYDERAERARQAIPAVFRERDTLVLKVSGSQLLIVGRRAGTVLYDDLHFRVPLPLKEGNSWLRAITIIELGA
ncbi:AraC family transcriptional regulator, partial [Paenibacillus sepulcri]|nr:AraC family transcriptional regulator [Paenibacillus sepulcri]